MDYMGEEATQQLIDVEQVLRSKLGRKMRFVPTWLVSFAKRLLHQDDVNAILVSANGREGVDFMQHAMQYMGVHIEVVGQDHLPPCTGRYTFASNHPLGGLDGIILSYVIGKHYGGNLKCIVNDLLMNLKPLNNIFIPTNKVGRQAKAYSQGIDKAFASNQQMLMFPAGICSRKHNGQVRDIAWKKAFITKSIENQRDVVPIYFDGRNSSFFYRLANLCDRWNAKFNLAMVFLPREMFCNKQKNFRMTIGKPIPWQTFDKSRTPMQWAQEVRKQVYELAATQA